VTSTGTPATAEAARALAETARRRATGWGALALSFYEPSVAWVEAVRSGHVQADLTAATSWLDVDGERFAPYLAVLTQVERAAGAREPDDVLADLMIEYTRLFVGPRRAVASPYESVWCDVDPDSGAALVNGPSTRQVEAVYGAHGVHLAESRHDLADHVATEMEFVHFLCRQEEQAWLAGPDDLDRAKALRASQQQFLQDHLGRFLPDLCEAVAQSTTEDVYRALAGVSSEFLSTETGSDYASTIMRGVFSHASRT